MKPPPTRMSLLALRRQREFAAKGAALLRTKREALLKELLALAPPLVASHAHLAREERSARMSLLMAKALDGRHRLKSAAMAVAPAAGATISPRKIWGVTVAEVAPLEASDSRLETPRFDTARIRETEEDFRAVLSRLIEIIPLEIRLKRLGPEVRATSRRINALEQILIPQLSARVETITRALEELEREDKFRLRRIKKKRGTPGCESPNS